MKFLILLVFTLLLTACATQNPQLIDRKTYLVDTHHASVGQNERVRFLVLHYTAGEDELGLKLLTQGQVSAHYLIPTRPAKQQNKSIALQLVPEEKRAWHAGISAWGTRNNLNDTSIGIEIVNLGFTERADGSRQWYPYSEEQIQLIIQLTKDIVQRYEIEPQNVVGHSDIAPLRKQDPGPLFPWERLAYEGVGAWPDSQTVAHYLNGRSPFEPADLKSIQRLLKQYGYDVPAVNELTKEMRLVIAAFQMHFRPHQYNGEPDAETEAILKALVEKYIK